MQKTHHFPRLYWPGAPSVWHFPPMANSSTARCLTQHDCGNLNSGAELTSFQGRMSWVTPCVSPDATRSPGSYDGTACLWETSSPKSLLFFLGHTNSVRSAGFLLSQAPFSLARAMGQHACGRSKSAKELTTFRGHTDAIKIAAFFLMASLVPHWLR